MAKTQKAKTRSKADQAEPQKGKKPKAARKPGELSRFQKVVVIIFIVVFALSTLAGALASVFQSQQQQSQSVEYNVEYFDNMYEDTVADLESTVEQNPDDSASLLTLANDYYTWGSYVSMLATTDDETSHGLDLFGKAMERYDQYLELAGDDTSSDDVNSARVSRAMCLYYQGQTDEALSALEELTQSSEDFSYAPAWADLGLLYEYAGSTDKAIAAYQRAIECDPDDEAGAKSYAEQRLESLQSDDSGDSASTSDSDGTADTSSDGTADDGASDGSSNDDTGSDASGDSASGAESLSEDLSNSAGTGL